MPDLHRLLDSPLNPGVARSRRGPLSRGRERLLRELEKQEPDPTEQAALEEITQLRQQGATLRGIAANLNRQSYRTRRGTPWRLESVARVLKPALAR